MKYYILYLVILAQLIFPSDSTNLAIYSKPFVNYVGPLPTVLTGGGIEIDSTKMNPNNLIDSNYFSFIEFPSGNGGSSFGIEMHDSVFISSIRIANFANHPTVAFNLRLRAFTIYGSNDTVVWSKLFQDLDNQDSSNYLAYINSKYRYKYLKVVVDSVNSLLSTVVSDIKVFVLSNPTNVVNTEYPFLKTFTLQQNYPNPFNPSTKINFNSFVNTNIKITIYDPLGRLIETIFNEEIQPGRYTVQWNASNYSSGIYFCVAQTKYQLQSMRLNLIK